MIDQAVPQPPPSTPPTAGLVLSPVPECEALETALRYLRAVVGDPSGNPPWPDDERLAALLAVASALVENEAPRAPQAIRNEACVRFVGYLAQRPSGFGAIRKVEKTAHPGQYAGSGSSIQLEFQTNHAAALLACGAKGLLSPWKIRRAGSIG